MNAVNLLRQQGFSELACQFATYIGRQQTPENPLISLTAGLLSEAMAKSADVFITSDIKYHEYFDADDKILLVDIGHYESEQYTIELLANFLQDKIPTFAVLKTETNTNPVQYFV